MSLRLRDALVSIVVPAFNRSTTIGTALRSVQAQTHSNWELVVVDDGSSDDTGGTVERYAAGDPRIRLVTHSENRGAQAARNTGIRHARGAWIAFLDADDRWLLDSLRLRLEAAAARRLRIIHSGAYRTREDGSTTLHRLPALEGWIYRQVLCQPGPMFQGLLVAGDALEAIGGLDERLVALQEWDTAIRLAERYEFGFVRFPTFVWDRGGGQTITKDRLRDARGYEQVVSKHTDAILSAAGTEALSRHYAILAARYLATGERSDALRCLRTLRRYRAPQP